jgi:hypothetical protein
LCEGDVVLVPFAGIARPVTLISRQLVWGVAYWHGHMDDVPVVLSEEHLWELEAGTLCADDDAYSTEGEA